jgi:hypothetical protein
VGLIATPVNGVNIAVIVHWIEQNQVISGVTLLDNAGTF